MNSADRLLDQLEQRLPLTRPAQLRKLKSQIARESKEPLLRNDQIIGHYRAEVALGARLSNTSLERSLILNAIRSTSGVSTVTVLTKPFPCPGRCVYCPTEAQSPKSYLPNEPPVLRALMNDYDPYKQVTSRLHALENTGHPTEKIELMIKGGTWSFYPDAYQREFIQRCFEAANDFSSALQPCETLANAQRGNETARHRIIGLTIETRPDRITQAEIRKLREWGVTRVELGVQTLENRILELTQRDHTTREVAQATKLLRDAGFKIAYHLMPNLPGATPEDDLQTFQMLFRNPQYQPDAVKIYPCVVVKSAELVHWWREGRYRPYDEETLLELLLQMKSAVPPFVRIERIARDIASDAVVAGSRRNNLREEVFRRMKQRGLRCRCVRCREVHSQGQGEFLLVRRDYLSADGREIFLSFEDTTRDRLAALLRMRIPSPIFDRTRHWLSALDHAALVRELHTYGWQLSLQDRLPAALQHRGFGRRLMAEAERIAREEWGLSRMAVISGVGVRGYYRKLGYEIEETYMVKML